jgi:hypothetical protein
MSRNCRCRLGVLLAKIDARDCNESDALLFGVDGDCALRAGTSTSLLSGVGGLDRGDPAERQLLGQPVLQWGGWSMHASSFLIPAENRFRFTQ